MATRKSVYFALAVSAALSASAAQASLIHRYSFTTDASDSVGAANGTLTNGATVSSGQLQLANPNFSGPSSSGQYLSLPATILPGSGSATIEQWFTFTGSGFFTEAYTFTNGANDSNPPSATNGQYLMHTISAPQNNGGNGNNTGGSHIGQTLAGYTTETDAFESTPGLGAGGGGYLDDGGTYMAATVIDGTAGTMSYYLYNTTTGLGGLQSTVTAIPLSAYSFTNAYLGRSAFPGDNRTTGTVDEFRIYNNAQDSGSIAADFAAGPNAVPEPASAALALFGAAGALLHRSRRRAAC